MKKYILFIVLLFTKTICWEQVFVNAYDNSHVSSNGIFGSTQKINETIISSIDTTKLNNGILINGIYKSLEPKLVNVSPLLQASKELIDSCIIFKQKITAENATSITITFDKLQLSSNAILYLYNPEGTVITGPITANENIEGSDKTNQTWSSNSFAGSSVILEFKIPEAEINQNELHIAKVIFGLPKIKIENTTDSTNIGNFNASSPCNINVVCPQGNAWQTERKAICLIQVEDGYASGALINNTCNLLIPNLLTAWHVQNGRNPSNWTFLFRWWSSTCTPNTNTSQSILFNGATLLSTYEPTDFCLVRLNQTPTQSLNLSFLGWNRQNVVPTSTTGIHHPEGDQMKICFDTDPPTIGNVRLNPNTAWRTVWKSGTTEHGSSGSPLFDQNHRVVGQDFSGSQPTYPPCNQQTGGNNYGRFDLSWTGGGTNATRLSNWLDPNNSGAITTNTTNISALRNINFSITGSQLLCSGSSTYSVNTTLPISWTVTPSGIVTPTSGTGSSITLTKVATGTITLTATVTGNCSTGTSASKIVNVGYSPVSITSTPTAQCNGSYQTWTLDAHPSSNGSNWYWSEDYVPPGSDIYIYNQVSPYTFVDVSGGGTVKLTYTDLCGTAKTDGVTIYSSCHSAFAFDIIPNPAQDYITVSSKNSDTKNGFQNFIYGIKITDRFGVLRKTFKYKQGINSIRILLNNLNSGTYLISVFDGNKWNSKPLLIQK